MSKKGVTTVRSGSGWANKRDGAKRASKRFRTQSAAIAAGRATAKREGVEHRIQGRDAKYRECNSYGNDPFPPRG